MILNNLTVRGQLALARKSLTDARARFTGHVHGIDARALQP